LDGKGFISKIEEELVPVSPIIGYAIKKQLADLRTTPIDLTPADAMKFVDGMTDALELFLGKAESQKKRKFMVSLLRKYAPAYFEEQSLI
jgi:hypothetical protein